MTRVSSPDASARNRGGRINATGLDRLLSLAIGTAWAVFLAGAAYLQVRPWPDILLHIDFSSYWMAATFLRDGLGGDLYDADKQYAFQLAIRQAMATSPEILSDTGYNPYPNPPVLALLYLPLTLLPIPVAYLLTWVIGLAAFVAAVALPLRGVPYARTSAVLMLTFAGVITTQFEGQPYGVMLLALTLALLALAGGRPLLGGSLLGLLWLKPQYAVLFLLVLVLKRRWTEAAGMLATGLLLGMASLALVGIDGARGYAELLATISEFHYRWVDPFAMVNWRALVVAAWPEIPGSVGSSIVYALGGVTVLASLLAWRGEWDPRSPRFPLQVLALTLAGILASPHSHLHGTVFLLAPVALALARSSKDCLPTMWTPLLLAGYLLSLAIWPGGLPRWTLAPCLLIAMAALTWGCWSLAGKRSAAGAAEPKPGATS